MRVPGYCTSCRRVKQVSANPHTWVTPGAIQGICFDCEEAAEKRFTVRDARGIALAHAETPERALWIARRRGVPVKVEERARRYPFTVIRTTDVDESGQS